MPYPDCGDATRGKMKTPLDLASCGRSRKAAGTTGCFPICWEKPSLAAGRLATGRAPPAYAARIATALLFCIGCAFVWYSADLLGRRSEVQPFKYAFGGEPAPRDYG